MMSKITCEDVTANWSEKEIWEDLMCRLSPENLHEDGEITEAQARKKEKQIRKEWKEHEKKCGRKYTEDEVFAMCYGEE